MPHDFPVATDIGHDRGKSGRHRFQQSQRCGFAQGCESEYVSRPHQIRDVGADAEKLHAAANASSYWYERFPEKMKLDPWELAYDYMTRSGRIDDERLAKMAPKFMARRPQ